MRHLISLLVLAVVVMTTPLAPAQAEMVNGIAPFHETTPLPPGAVFEALLEDTSRADAKAPVLGRTTVADPDPPVIAFSIPYDGAAIDPRATYAVRARITEGGRLLYTSDRVHRVRLTPGASSYVTVTLRRVGPPAAAPAPSVAQAAEASRFLAGPFVYVADAARLTLCETGRDHPVAMEGDYLRLEQAYLDARATPGQPVFVTLEGRIEERPRREGEGREDSVVVTRFIHAWPGETCERNRAEASLINTYWRIVRLGDEAVRATEGRREPHLLLRDDGTRFNATVGCNQMVGGYVLDGGTLRFGQAASTMMACPPPLDRWEGTLAETLANTRAWRINAQFLELLDGDGRPLALLQAVYLR